MSTIVLPIRNVNLTLPGLFEDMYNRLAKGILAEAQRHVNRKLEEKVTEGLGREWYERREKTQGSSIFQCQRCGTRWRKRFSRNGSRSRELTLAIGTIAVALPRLVCECGGSVQLHLVELRPRQRMGDDLTALVQHWTELAYSLREMKGELDESLQSSVGLRGLSERFHQIAEQVPNWQRRFLEDVPEVVALDAIWVTLLEETEEVKRDKKGRKRRVKKRRKLPVLIAVGVWPEEGRCEVLDWEIGDGPGEDRDSWLRLLNRLEERGLNPSRGLRLFIHDGGEGLIAALQEVFWDVPRQRCIFHKLRNVWRAIVPPEDKSAEEKKAYRQKLIKQASLIWQASTLQEAERRYRKFCRDWFPEQPAAVLTLQRDFQGTLTFYTLMAQNRLWQARYLRTTSLLERLNRKVRARMRKAGAFHSRSGLEAMLAQVLAGL
jgi:putative transposase